MRRCLLPILAAAMAAGPVTADPVPEGLRAALIEHIPGVVPEVIRETPVEGLYEVWYGPRIYYATRDGRHVLRGDLIDLVTRENITRRHRADARREALEKIAENTMIVFGRERLEHTVTVFTDIDCPYCQRLHAQIEDYNRLGIRVRYLAFPRAGLESRAYDETVSVWCADDRRSAMTAAKAGRGVESRSCPNPVADHFEVGRFVGVSGTPTIVLESGEVVSGYVPPDGLLAILEQDEG